MKGNTSVRSADAHNLIAVTLDGIRAQHFGQKESMQEMPGFAGKLSGKEVAALSNYMHASWGGAARGTEAQVTVARREVPATATAAVAIPAAAPPSPGPVSPDLAMAGVDAAPLLKALFGDYATAKDGGVVAALNDPDQPGSQGLYLLSRVASTVLPGGETVLVFNGEACNDAGEAQTAHATPGLLSIFVLKQEGAGQGQGAWRVLRRHENFAALGVFGNVGTLSWVTLAPGRVGLAAESGGTWQGYTSMFLSLFDVADPQPRELMGPDGQVLADTEGTCGGRVAECWDVRARWRVLPPEAGARYADLAMDFEGEERVATPRQPGGR